MKKEALIISLVTLIVGCTGENNSQIANPASVNCIDKGYELELRGSTGYCVFPDGSECEEWSFYRNNCDYNLSNSCSFYNGSWIEDFKECEGISKDNCERIGGFFNECASACRNDPSAEFCTLQCVVVCEFD